MTQAIAFEPIELDDGYVLMNTEMLMELLAEGKSVYLPELAEMPDGVSGYSDADMEDYRQGMKVSEIESVVYVGEEDVQCIEIADDQHLYLTDHFINSHNTSNIIFLKSTDDSMLDTLEKMSGKTHQVRIESKMITRDIDKMWQRNQGNENITLNVKEEPVIAYSDMAFLAERNSIVFRAGDNPIWNRNETILPMSWRLFKTKIEHPGHDYSLQTIPTLSSAIDFDVRRNQPDFNKMLEKRLAQAVATPDAMQIYKEAYGYEDYDIEKLDPDVYSDAIMDIVNACIADRKKTKKNAGQSKASDAGQTPAWEPDSYSDALKEERENEEFKREAAINQKRKAAMDMKRFAGNMISQSDLVTLDGHIAGRNMEETIKDAYLETRAFFENDRVHFAYRDDTLFGVAKNGQYPVYIHKLDESESLTKINTVSGQLDNRVYTENDINPEDLNHTVTIEITDDFFRFLAEQDSWMTFASGEFEKAMARRFRD